MASKIAMRKSVCLTRAFSLGIITISSFDSIALPSVSGVENAWYAHKWFLSHDKSVLQSDWRVEIPQRRPEDSAQVHQTLFLLLGVGSGHETTCGSVYHMIVT